MLRNSNRLIACFLFLSVALYGQQSGSLGLSPAGSLSYSFSFNASTGVCSVTIGASYSDPWYIETGATINGGVLHSTPAFPSAVGATGSGTYTFSASPGDVIVISANGRNGANGAGTEVRTATWTVGTAPKKVTVSLRNTRNIPVTYQLKQDGVILGSVVLQPGQAVIQTFNVDSSSNVEVFELVNNLARDGDNWVYSVGAVHTETVGSVTPSSVPDGSPDPDPVTVDPSPNIPSSVTPPSPGRQVVWRSVTPNEDPEAQTDLLTNETFREGVEKLLENETGATEQANKNDRAFLTAAVASQAEAQSELVNSLVNTHLGETPGAVDSGITGSGGSWPSFTLPLLGTIVLSPDRIPWLSPILTALREALLWLMVLAFVRFGIETCNAYELQALGMPQVETTVTAAEVHAPFLGQLSAWLKQSITAAVIVSVLIAAYGAAVLVMDTQIGAVASSTWRLVVSGSDAVQNVVTVSGGNGLWPWLLSFFPLRAFISLLIGEVVFLFAIGKIFLVASALVKAIRA